MALFNWNYFKSQSQIIFRILYKKKLCTWRRDFFPRIKYDLPRTLRWHNLHILFNRYPPIHTTTDHSLDSINNCPSFVSVGGRVYRGNLNRGYLPAPWPSVEQGNDKPNGICKRARWKGLFKSTGPRRRKDGSWKLHRR